MPKFTYQPSSEELKKAQAFSEQIENLVANKRFEIVFAEQVLGDQALPDYIMEVSADLKNTYVPNTFLEQVEDGPTLMQGALNITKSQAQKYLKDPKTASVLFRSLRDKLEDMEDKKRRASAEEHGFIATVIYTIKRAMYWLIKKFNDVRDDFLDMTAERPAHSSQAKRDYNWLMNRQRDYMIQNTDWYLNSEH